MLINSLFFICTDFDLISCVIQVLVSVNPYRDLPVYGPEYIKSYKGREMFERPAHIFALAEAAYRTLKQRSLNSCIVISGRNIIEQYVLISFY